MATKHLLCATAQKRESSLARAASRDTGPGRAGWPSLAPTECVCAHVHESCGSRVAPLWLMVQACMRGPHLPGQGPPCCQPQATSGLTQGQGSQGEWRIHQPQVQGPCPAGSLCPLPPRERAWPRLGPWHPSLWQKAHPHPHSPGLASGPLESSAGTVGRTLRGLLGRTHKCPKAQGSSPRQ